MLHFTKNPLTLDPRGLHFGRGTLLAKSDGRGRVDIGSAMPRIVTMLKAAYGGGIPDYIPCRIAGALESWNKGQTSIALTKLTQIHLPDPFTDPNAAERLAKAQADFDKAGTGGGHDVSNEARVPAGNPDGGQWTTGGDNSDDSDDNASESGIILAAGKAVATPADKQAFVDKHLADAQWAANQLGVPVENILGISALESQWGEYHFAKDGNNFLGMQAGSSFAIGSIKAKETDARVAIYASYRDNLRSFVEDKGWIVKNKSDPTQFMQALQDNAGFGVNYDGTKVPYYVKNSAATIVGLRRYIRNRTL